MNVKVPVNKQNKGNLGETDTLTRNKNSCSFGSLGSRFSDGVKCARCLLWSALGRGMKARVDREEIKLQRTAMTDCTSVSGVTRAFQSYPKLGQDARAFIPHIEQSLEMNHPRSGVILHEAALQLR